MPLEHIELAKLNIPDDAQTRARFDDLTRPGGLQLQQAETYEACDPEVQAPMNNLGHEKTDLTYHWTGPASAKYQDKVTAQNDAIAAVATKADNVSKWLMDIAKYNIEYMTKLAEMATGFLGALVAAAIETATVIGIPFAVKDLAGAIGTLVTQSLDNLVGIAKRFAEALSKVRDILSMMSDPKLPKNQWPQAVTG